MDDVDENESSGGVRHSNSMDSIMSAPKFPTNSPSTSLTFQMDTPSLGEEAKASLRQQHTLHISDSGFSEWSPSFSSLESLDQTPNLQGLSSQQSSINLSPTVKPVPQKLSPRNHRRSWPLKSRKLSFLSLDGPLASPVLDITSQHKLHSDSDPSLSEEFGKVMMPKSELPGAGKHSLLSQVLHRSRSSSRSPSSLSDDLESSFQEMSLEESSSDSAQNSPRSPLSSSPVFTFTPHHRGAIAKVSHSETERNVSPQLITDIISSPLTASASEESADHNSECLSSLSPPQHFTSSQIANSHKQNIPLNELNSQSDFVACLSLAPVQIQPLQPGLSQDCSLEPIPQPHKPCLVVADLTKPPSFHFQHCCANDQSSLECKGSSLAKPDVSTIIKSPSKRNASKSEKCCVESVSPSKMRRLKRIPECTVTGSKLKCDLFGSDQIISGNSLRRDDSLVHFNKATVSQPDDRVPQFLCIGANIEDSGKLLGSSAKNDSVRLKHPSRESNKIECGPCEEKTAELIDRVCCMFSPANISKLIGRRIGVKQIDIISELRQQNFMECLALIFSYIPDSDLMKLVEVSDEWKGAMLEETKASRRYKSLWRKLNSPRKKNKQSANKENVQDKSQQAESTLLTPSKGHLTAIQPQTTSRLDVVSVSKNLNFQQSPHDLQFEDRVRHCPHCHSRALILPSQDRAVCMSDKCAYNFCTKCFCPFHHSSLCKPLFQLASRTTLAGTKKSKKNLKRLKNL